MSAKVSVIIPVYNVEKYIRQTLDSVINQTFKDIEIIIVDNNHFFVLLIFLITIVAFLNLLIIKTTYYILL